MKQEYTDEELWKSLKLVQIHETVSNIGGLSNNNFHVWSFLRIIKIIKEKISDARVQDGGSNLSVGEKQLICLARAILRNTYCLILDEATNSLQPDVEMEFLNMIFNIFQKRSIVVITVSQYFTYQWMQYLICVTTCQR